MFSGLSGYIKGVKNALHGTATQAKPTLGRVRVGNREIDEIKLISQGGYAYVFLVKDTQTGETFALKKMICQSPERFQTAKNEIKMLRSLPNHPNLLRVFDSSVETKGDCYYVYVLLEYCDGGSIFDLMAKYEASKLSEKQIIFIMREVCEGVKVLHSCNPPIAHRDLKIENVLLSNKRFKLCDFGSCSTSYVDFSKIPQSQYATYEEEYDKNTTLMYRPPEMCDPYQRQIVSQKVDIWMLGCILYTMCFYKHPFQEMTKLSIVNAAYTFPEDHPYPEKLIDLIRIMLTPHPNYRPDIFEICDLMNSYFDIKSVKLNPDAQRIREEQKKNAMEMRKFENPNSKTAKFNGDIPIEELMKIQKQLQRDEDESPMANKQFQSEERNNRQQQQRQQSRQNGPKPHHHHFDSFDSFGKPKKQAPEIHHFNSSPGLQQNNEWHNFGQKSAEKQTPKQSSNSQWDSFGQSPPPKQLSSFAQFGSSNQDRSNNQSNQSVTNQNSSNDQWKNFNSTPASGSNNTMNNSGNSWAQNNWAPQNQQSQTQPQSVPNNWAPQNQQSQIAQNNWASQNQQSQSAQNWSSQNQQFQSNNNFNAFNSQPSNNQSNNTWNSFGSNTNNQFSQNNNSNGMNQTQNNVPTVTNDLLDLADTSAKSKTPNIMDLYSMNK